MIEKTTEIKSIIFWTRPLIYVVLIFEGEVDKQSSNEV